MCTPRTLLRVSPSNITAKHHIYRVFWKENLPATAHFQKTLHPLLYLVTRQACHQQHFGSNDAQTYSHQTSSITIIYFEAANFLPFACIIPHTLCFYLQCIWMACFWVMIICMWRSPVAATNVTTDQTDPKSLRRKTFQAMISIIPSAIVWLHWI